MIEQRIKATFGDYQVPAVVYAVQGDTGRVFVFESADRTLTGTETASLMCIRPNGTAFSYAGVVDSDTQTITVELDTEGGALTQDGVVAAQLVMQQGGEILCSFRLGIIVEPALGGEATPEQKDFLDGLQAQLDEWIADAASNFITSSRTINGKAMTSDIILDGDDIPYSPTQSVNDKIDENAGAISTAEQEIDDLQTDKLDVSDATVNGKALPATLYVQDLTSNDTDPTSPTYAQTNVELTQGLAALIRKTLAYKDFTKANITIPGGLYGTVGNFYSAIGLPSGAYVVSYYIRGWSGAPGCLSLVSSSDGDTLYVQCSATGTITSLSVRVFYALL